jgi:5'-deoxynucleotidase YfbR-like HD superfamily hydrolase
MLTHGDKKGREAAALKRLEEEWSQQFPEMVNAIREYEHQETEEARLVYATDKLVACSNVTQDKGRTWKLQQVTFLDVDAYTRPRVSKHSCVEELYKELRAFLQSCPELFHTEK